MRLDLLRIAMLAKVAYQPAGMAILYFTTGKKIVAKAYYDRRHRESIVQSTGDNFEKDILLGPGGKTRGYGSWNRDEVMQFILDLTSPGDDGTFDNGSAMAELEFESPEHLQLLLQDLKEKRWHLIRVPDRSALEESKFLEDVSA